MFDFTDKVVLVTGAAGNLGRATAARFAASGARLALADHSLHRLRDAFPDSDVYGEALLIPVDLLDEKCVGDMASTVTGQFGHVDVLANIAGGFTMGPKVHETTPADWDFMMNLNARSVFYASRAVLPAMLERGRGRIVSVSARAAREGKARMAPYCASKAAVITLTEALAAEYRDQNINVNCILPGTIDTPENRAAMPDADHSRWVPPEDLARVILFLASDEARSVTGAAIPVYGRS